MHAYSQAGLVGPSRRTQLSVVSDSPSADPVMHRHAWPLFGCMAEIDTVAESSHLLLQ